MLFNHFCGTPAIVFCVILACLCRLSVILARPMAYLRSLRGFLEKENPSQASDTFSITYWSWQKLRFPAYYDENLCFFVTLVDDCGRFWGLRQLCSETDMFWVISCASWDVLMWHVVYANTWKTFKNEPLPLFTMLAYGLASGAVPYDPQMSEKWW